MTDSRLYRAGLAKRLCLPLSRYFSIWTSLLRQEVCRREELLTVGDYRLSSGAMCGYSVGRTDFRVATTHRS